MSLQKLSLLLCLSLGSLTHAHAGGGIGSGGGGTLPANPVQPSDIEYVARTSKLFVQMIFNHLEHSAYATPEIRAKLFGGPKTVFDFIRTNGLSNVYVDFNQPCADLDGASVDGSIVAPQGYAVCISAFTITKKLPKSEAFPQIIALIVHEYSHLTGLDEKEASDLQWYVADRLADANFNITEADTFRMRALSEGVAGYGYDFRDVKSLMDSFATQSDAERMQKTREILRAISEREKLLDYLPFAFLRGSKPALEHGFQIRLRLIYWALLARSGTPEAGYAARFLTKVFQTDAQIDIATYDLRNSNSDFKIPGSTDVKFSRIVDATDLQSELVELQKEAAALKELSEAIY